MSFLHIRLSDLHLHCRCGAASEPAQIGNAFNAPHSASSVEKQVTQRNGAPYFWALLHCHSSGCDAMMRAKEKKPMNRFAAAAATAAARVPLRHVAHCGPRKAAAAAAADIVVSGRHLWPSSLVVARMRNCDITKAA